MQQQPALADLLAIQPQVQLAPGLQRRGLARGAEGDTAASQQGRQHLGSAAALALQGAAGQRKHQIGAAAPGLGRHTIQLRVPQPDRGIRRAQTQVQAGLVGEFGIGRHHHVGVGIGGGQPLLAHQPAVVGRQPHPQPALALALQQLRLAAPGQGLRRGGFHGSGQREARPAQVDFGRLQS